MALTALYLAAGLSSRFGGRIKAIIKVGPNDETLMELSMLQAVEAGFDSFVIVVSNKTIDPIRDYFGDSFKGLSVDYVFQETPSYREKPFGTGHAVLAAKDVIKNAFVMMNSDDLYGINSLKKVVDYIKENEEGYCILGYRLRNVLPEQGTVNRGLITVDDDSNMIKIEEQFGISRDDIPSKYSGEELFSMNFFVLQPEFFSFLEKDFEEFLKENPDDVKKECLILDSVTHFQNEKNVKIKVIPTEDEVIGVTNPEDEEIVKELLKQKHL